MGFEKSRWGKGNPFWVDRELDRRDNMDRLPWGHLAGHVLNPVGLSGVIYGGHVIWKDAPNYISTISIEYTDTDQTLSEYSATTNVDLSTHIPDALKKIHGLIVYVSVYLSIATTKTKSATTATSTSYYSVAYNTAPSLYNRMAMFKFAHTAQDADNEFLYAEAGNQVFIPVVWNDGIPYITWRIDAIFTGMTAENANYLATHYMYLQGYIT